MFLLRPILLANAIHEELHSTASRADVDVKMVPLDEQLAELAEDAPVRPFVKALASDVLQRLVATGARYGIRGIRHTSQYDDFNRSFAIFNHEGREAMLVKHVFAAFSPVHELAAERKTLRVLRG